MTHVETLSREQFLAWLGTQKFGASDTVPQNRRADRDSVSLVWADATDPRPPIVAVPSNKLKEFFAFTATYIGSYSPFTAFFKVIPSELVDFIPLRRPTRPPQDYQWLIGPMIAEAYSQIGGSARRVGEISMQAALATQAAVSSQAIWQTYEPGLVSQAATRWDDVRTALRSDSRSPFSNAAEFWLNLAYYWNDLGGNRTTGVRRHDYGGINPFHLASSENEAEVAELWRDMTLGSKEFAFVLDYLRGTRENRVVATQEAFAMLVVNRQIERPSREMIAGYLGSRVGNGSFEYMSLLDNVGRELPLAILWFGFFSGCRPNSDVLNVGECLGRRLLNKIAFAGGTPDMGEVDISWEELLQVLDEGRLPRMRTELQSVVRVEILPGVIGRFKNVRDGRSELDSRLTSERIRELRRSLAHASRIAQDLDRSSEADLFESKSESTAMRNAANSKVRLPRRK